ADPEGLPQTSGGQGKAWRCPGCSSESPKPYLARRCRDRSLALSCLQLCFGTCWRGVRTCAQTQGGVCPLFSVVTSCVGRAHNEHFKHPADSNVFVNPGETGSGKTTQIPQYLYEAGIGRQGVIAVTQPRRVAAISLATRVSDEKRTELGKLVGYTVRFDDLTSDETRIKFLTDGMLLREAIGDPLLRKYSVVILDEAHERTIHTDVLFGVVKAAQKKRKELGKLPLKVVVMSATMDVDQFSQYFNGAPVLYLEGRQHPIQVFYTKQPQSDYLQAALVSVFQIHQVRWSRRVCASLGPWAAG
uniref:RNA helicase n=1 Tax=Anser cygnoides TaxID=8845 RepID=A0A8B9IQ86_ANSCY